MANAMYIPRNPFYGGTMEYPTLRGRSNVNHLSPLTRQTLATDPAGTTKVTFDGVIAGSEIRVYDASLNELAGIESCAANQQLTWPVYASNSPNNNVEIKIYNTGYRLKKFPYTSKVGDQSIPVQMERDRWYNNP